MPVRVVVLNEMRKQVMIKDKLKPYVDRFSESGFWQKIHRYARQAGIKTVYSALLLFYAYRRKETPKWAKTIVLGTLGYFISPIDFLPDLSPIIGYTDDIGWLSFGLVTIASYINTEVRENARERLKKWFGEYDPKELEGVDEKL
jgi:uncharacterized membrane protein YkvA (DUF1232 family)